MSPSRRPPLGIIPARAGSTSATSLVVMWLPDHPRSRGEHPIVPVTKKALKGSSPLARGAHRVGVTITGDVKDHPRSRGEHMTVPIGNATEAGSSPLARGAHILINVPVDSLRIIPARAGSTELARAGATAPWDHPRSRGEHQQVTRSWSLRGGSSPLARGAPVGARPTRPRHRIIPARAGSTLRRGLLPAPTRDHPRSRGEHPDSAHPLMIPDGSSPLARGARATLRPGVVYPGIILARAGSTT